MKILLKQIAVTILLLYIKTCQGKGGCHDDWNPEVNECTSCNIFDEQGYEEIPCKGNRTEDTVRKCPCGKIQPDKNFSEHALMCMEERKCQEDFTSSPGNASVVEHVYNSNNNAEDEGLSTFIGFHFIKYFDAVVSRILLFDKRYASIPEEDWTKRGERVAIVWNGYPGEIGTQHHIIATAGKNRFASPITFIGSALRKHFTPSTPTNISDLTHSSKITSVINPWNRRDKDGNDDGLSTLTGSDTLKYITRSAPTNIVDASPPSGEANSIGFDVSDAISTAVIVLAVVITGICLKCYVDRRWRSLNNGTENEHEPLNNHDGSTYIPMTDLNVNRTHVPGELQASDADDRNGNTDTNCESLEGQHESESKGMTGIQSNDYFHTDGPFCRCCGHHWKRCNKRNIKQIIARVKPQQGVNEMPPTETVEVEVLVDGYSNISSSISHHPQSHGSTSTVDEETTHVKSVYGNEQVSSTVTQTNEADGTCFEESQQADLHNEDHMTTGIPVEGDLFRADFHLGRTNHDEEQMTAENEDDVEEV